MNKPDFLAKRTHLAALLAAWAVVVGCAAPSPPPVTAEKQIALYGEVAPDAAAPLLRVAREHIAFVAESLDVAPPDNALNLILFDSAAEMRRYLAAHCPRLQDHPAACWSTAGRFSIALPRENPAERALPALRHELTHYVLAARFGRLAPWLDEGLAQRFATVAPSGKLSPAEVESVARPLSRPDAQAVERLLAAPYGRALTREEYAQAGALVAHLMNARREALIRYLHGPRSGAEGARRLADCFRLDA